MPFGYDLLTKGLTSSLIDSPLCDYPMISGYTDDDIVGSDEAEGRVCCDRIEYITE